MFAHLALPTLSCGRRPAWMWAAGILFVACNAVQPSRDLPAAIALDADAAADVSEATALPLDSLIPTYARRNCELAVKCTLGLHADPSWLQTCALLEANFLFGNLPYYHVLDRIRLVELGRLKYDGVAASRCLAAVSCLTNGGHWATPWTGEPLTLEWLGGIEPESAAAADAGGCSAVFFGGQAEVGQACDDDAECTSGRCWGCPGRCRVPTVADTPCGRNTPCELGMNCLPSRFGGFRCVPRRPIAIGGACLPAAQHQWQHNDGLAPCAPGGWCSDATGICEALGDLGALCTSWDQCTPGLACAGSKNPRCTFPVPVGGICQNTFDCVGNGNGSVQCLPADLSSNGKVIQRCWQDAATTPCGTGSCPLGSYCADRTGKGICATNRQPGASCVPGATGCNLSYCDYDKHVCTTFQHCASPSCPMEFCENDGSCPAARIGDSCSLNPDCNYYACLDGQCRAPNAACGYPENTP